ncbi:MAG TPA: hypothetical protein VND21_00670, partial [Planctomycetota bacterium]|nr:hypothetical protein [Planctomycetota bacterium]
AVAGAAGRPPAAEARPEYSRKEGRACQYCHVNPRGGGARNPKGQEYERNGFTFKAAGGAAKGFGENDAFSSEANGRAFYFVREAMDLEHWGDALRRLTALAQKERKGPGAQLVANTIAQVDNRGRDLARAAKQSIAESKAKEAAEALVRLEGEFRGREPAKEATRIRAELRRLTGAKEAEDAAKAAYAQRVTYCDVVMRNVEGDTAGAIAAMEAFLAKHPDGPFAEQARGQLEEWRKPLDAPPAMGG